MLEELETVTVPVEFDAFELLDRNADAKALHDAGLWPPLRSPGKVTSPPSQVRRHQRQGESKKDGQELPAVELVPVRRFKQDGGRDVQQNADEESVQCAECGGILRQGSRKEDAEERHHRKHGDPRPSAYPGRDGGTQDGHEGNRHRQLVKANAEQQPPSAFASMVMMVPMVVVSMVVMDVLAQVFQSEGHGLDEGVETEAQKGQGAKSVAMHVAVLHPLAQVLQPDLDEKPPNDPQTGTAVGFEGFGKQMEETQAKEERSTESEQQGQLTAEAVAHGLSQGGAHHGDEEQDQSGGHAMRA